MIPSCATAECPDLSTGWFPSICIRVHCLESTSKYLAYYNNGKLYQTYVNLKGKNLHHNFRQVKVVFLHKLIIKQKINWIIYKNFSKRLHTQHMSIHRYDDR